MISGEKGWHNFQPGTFCSADNSESLKTCCFLIVLSEYIPSLMVNAQPEELCVQLHVSRLVDLSSCWVWEWAWSEILRYQVSWNKVFYTIGGILIFALTDNLPYCWNIVIYDSHLYHFFIAISLILPHPFHSVCGIKCHIWDIACPNK